MHHLFFSMLMTPTEKALQAKVDKLEAENALLLQRCEQMSQAYDQLLFQFNELKRFVFGQRSARYIDPNHPQQNLLNEMHESSMPR